MFHCSYSARRLDEFLMATNAAKFLLRNGLPSAIEEEEKLFHAKSKTAQQRIGEAVSKMQTFVATMQKLEVGDQMEVIGSKESNVPSFTHDGQMPASQTDDDPLYPYLILCCGSGTAATMVCLSIFANRTQHKPSS